MVVGRVEQGTTRSRIPDYGLLVGAALALLVSAGLMFGIVPIPF